VRFREGDTFAARSGNRSQPALEFEVRSALAVGGQGFGYRVTELRRGWPAFAKTFLPQYVGTATSDRTRWLCHQGIDHPGLLVPRYVIEEGGHVVGHVSPMAEGTGLQEAIFPEDGSSGPAPVGRVGLARDVARSLVALHGRGIAHGDVSGGNVILSSASAVHLIDFDNFAAPSAPPPFMQGTLRYLAGSVLEGEPPSGRSDVFSALVLTHELLLGRHPFIPPDVPGSEEGQRAQEALMRSARWLDDPVQCRDGHAARGGAPVRWLSPGLIHLFRDTFRGAARPTAEELARALESVAVRPCAACGFQALHDERGGNPHCPWCGGALRSTVRLSWGRNSLSLPEGTHVVGRREIAHPEVSREHFRLTVSPNRVTLEDMSRHGTWLGRRRLDGRPVVLRLPALLRVGPIVVEVRWA